MNILEEYISVIGIFHGLLLSGLLIFGFQVSNASRILGVWCLFLALSFLGHFIITGREPNLFSFLLGWHYFLPAGYGAFLYLYCRHALIEQEFSVADFWHFCPMIVCYLLNIEFLFLGSQAKLDIVYSGQQDSTLMDISQMILFSQAYVYIGFSVGLIRKYQNQAKNNLSNFNPDIFNWLWKLLILDSIIWSLKAFALVSEYGHQLSLLGDALIIFLIYSIALAQWRNPRLFKIDLNRPLGETDNNGKSKNNGALDSSLRNNLLEVVRNHMRENKAFQDNQLTLARLSKSIGVSTHHLSEVLNQHDGKNFYKFVNEYRVEFVCEQLKQDPLVKILDVAMTAGFSSKSTFNAVFKQVNNVTPSQYRKQLSL